MKVTLFGFQEDALIEIQKKLVQARTFASSESPQAISFSAPTGSGKTIVMTALFEDIFFGEPNFPAQSDAAILWISDMPELNKQTRLKIEGKSDRIRVSQLVTIDSSFDAERLEGGHIYFVNTQKLGDDKLLTRKGDSRQYTLWETLTNTAIAIPNRFYVVIDEAHRGMQHSARSVKKAQTILQKFLLGSEDDGLCAMPLVLGMTATPRRFDKLLEGTPHTVHKVYVPAEDVRKSGLLKERILIHYPDINSQAEMTLLTEATKFWQSMTEDWDEYCQSEKLESVRPLLVIQVEDGTDSILTRTNLNTALTAVESTIGRSLQEGEAAHTFNDHGEIEIGAHRIHYIEASQIEDDSKINVVLFKMSLSTGWDCPRAEVMMSFRSAQDHTYIAQLLGRMVRTPLAHRVEKEAGLNDVHLFLPHYNEKTVDDVIKDLQNEEDVPPAKVGTSRELVTLQKRGGTEAIFEAMQDLVTYRVGAVRKQSSLRRLMGLGRGLTYDQIDEFSQEQVTQSIISLMTIEIERLKASGDFEQCAQGITGIDLKTVALHGMVVEKGKSTYTLAAAEADIDHHFEQAGRLLSNGLHTAFWKNSADREASEVKVEVIVLSQDHNSMQALEKHAESEFNRLYAQYKRDLIQLKEKRRKHYDNLRLATAKPETILWVLPDSIPFRRTPKASTFEKHLYIDENKLFQADMGTWEQGVLEEEFADSNVVAWLRNIDRQNWSLEIPYRDGGTIKPMFPDMIIVRQDAKGYIFDVLEPHDPSLGDNAAKAVGLAEFAENHWAQFGRIQLIRRKRGADGQEHYYRLDVSNEATRKKVLAISSNDQLDRIFNQEAKTK